MTTTVSDFAIDADLELRRCADEVLPDLVACAVLTGTGNVIAVVEVNATADLPITGLRAVTAALCSVPGPVRIDGVLFFYPQHERGLRMVFFDRDGTWETMCGNGLRCVARYAADLGLFTGTGEIVTDDGVKRVWVHDRCSTVTLGSAREVRRLGDDSWFAYTGVAHLVIFVPDADALKRISVRDEGARLRFDTELCRDLGHPEGVHVDFVAVDGPGLVIRTYEVGVEDETDCCGTGAAAAAYLAAHSGRSILPTRLRFRGGEVEVGLADVELTLRGEVEYLVPRRAIARTALVAVGGRDER